MTSCRELTEQASDYLEHQLSRRRRLAIRLHLLICEGCRRYLRQYRAVCSALRGLGDTQPAPTRVVFSGRRLTLAGAFASLLAAVALWQVLGRADFSAAMLAQARHDPAPLAPQALPAPQVAQLLAAYGLTLASPLTHVHYAHPCHVLWRRAAHLVLVTPAGEVAVFVLRRGADDHSQTTLFDQRVIALHTLPGVLLGIVADSPAAAQVATATLQQALPGVSL